MFCHQSNKTIPFHFCKLAQLKPQETRSKLEVNNHDNLKTAFVLLCIKKCVENDKHETIRDKKSPI